MCVRVTEGNEICSPQRPLRCKKAAITAAKLLVEGVTSERKRKNKEGKGSLYNLPENTWGIRGPAELFFKLGVGGGWSALHPGRFIPPA